MFIYFSFSGNSTSLYSQSTILKLFRNKKNLDFIAWLYSHAKKDGIFAAGFKAPYCPEKCSLIHVLEMNAA